MTAPVTAVLEVFDIFPRFKVDHGDMALVESFGLIQEGDDISVVLSEFSQLSGVLGWFLINIGNVGYNGNPILLLNLLSIYVMKGKDELFTLPLFLDSCCINHREPFFYD